MLAARVGRVAERFASHTTVRTDEAVSRARLFEVFSAGSIIREERLKLRQRLSPVQTIASSTSPSMGSRHRPCSRRDASTGGCLCEPDRQAGNHTYAYEAPMKQYALAFAVATALPSAP
jgi:hypothetical protein